MVKIVRIPTTPLDRMFAGGPTPYTPGTARRDTPPDDKGEARAPEPFTPASGREEPNAPPIEPDDKRT